MNIFKEMPIVFPFYDNEKHFSIRSEHREGNCVYKLISPKNALFPQTVEISHFIGAGLFTGKLI